MRTIKRKLFKRAVFGNVTTIKYIGAATVGLTLQPTGIVGQLWPTEILN